MLKKVYEDLDHYFVTVRNDFSERVLEKERAHYVTQILRDPVKLLLNDMQSYRILRKEKPDVIITTGAGDVFPTCFLGKMQDCRIVFLETFARVSEPSMVGRLLNPLADLTLVQWKPMLQHYKNAQYSGPIYEAAETQELPDEPKVFVVTGTHTASFHRLVKSVDELVGKGEIAGLSGAQIGHSTHEPKNFPWSRFLPYEEFLEQLRTNDIILTHDGASSIGLALSFGKRVVVVPRRREFREVEYASKQNLARHLASEGLVVLVEDVLDIPAGLAKAKEMKPPRETRKEKGPAHIIKEFLENL